MSVTAPTQTPTTTPTTGNATSTTINNSLASLASNSQTFLTLLTTQLKNQDPTSPLDTSQFTAQITQLAGVEQQLLSNQLLQQLVNQSTGSGVAGAVGLIGKNVTASGNTAVLQNGAATWQYTLGGAATTVQVQVTDSSGNVVFSGPAQAGSGAQTFTWNGQNSAGQQQANGGTFTLKVSAADSSGQAVNVSNAVQGSATAVEQVSGQTLVTVNGAQVPLSAITAISGST